jgi:hypothetical protein
MLVFVSFTRGQHEGRPHTQQAKKWHPHLGESQGKRRQSQTPSGMMKASDPSHSSAHAIALVQHFACMIVEDSSTYTLPDELQAVWKGCGGRSAGTLSACKIQVRWNLLIGALRTMARLPRTPTQHALSAQRAAKARQSIALVGFAGGRSID